MKFWYTQNAPPPQYLGQMPIECKNLQEHYLPSPAFLPLKRKSCSRIAKGRLSNNTAPSVQVQKGETENEPAQSRSTGLQASSHHFLVTRFWAI